MTAQVWDSNLPKEWNSYAAADGRIFFLNEKTKASTWLHPVTGVPVQTGHKPLPDLPKGWEQGITSSGITYYIDHNRQQTSLVHPITGLSEASFDGICSPTPEPPRSEGPFTNAQISVPSAFAQEIRKQITRRNHVGSWVKGPGLRNPDPSTVSHKGWLLKQGSDGLHLWKRRWFVLSEYCLYYYKGPDEDKVLGYIPLPSFKIRPVDPEDRVYKRHAFKAEHQNTRTYFFASESKDQMTHWMNALSLASILQRDTSLEDKNSSGSSTRRSDRPSLSSLASSTSPLSPSADDSDSGFDGYKSKRPHPPASAVRRPPQGRPHHLAPSPVAFKEESSCYSPDQRSLDRLSLDEVTESSRPVNDRLNTSLDSNQLIRPGSRQPFYANAPPKPRRLNTSYEQCSTPDKSPVITSTNRFLQPCPNAGLPSNKNLDLRKSQPGYCSSERRTPEAYGATSSRGEYEDVYGSDHELLLHSYRHAQHHNRQRESYASSRSGGTHLSDDLNLSTCSHSQISSHLPSSFAYSKGLRRSPGPPRPHSADFLDHEIRHRSQDMRTKRRGIGEDGLDLDRQQIRPKSSIGYHEGDFWSEENYAAKMRESAFYKSYLQATPRSPLNPVPHSGRGSATPNHNVHQIGQRVPPAGAATPDLYVPQNLALPQRSPTRKANSKGGSLKRGTDHNTIQHQWQPPYPSSQQQVNGDYLHDADSSGFLRSASARLSKSNCQNDHLNTSFPEDGVDNEKKMQQREESMKRLLEWKQRMLHSPLTRKSNSRPDSSASSASSKTNSPHSPAYLNAKNSLNLHHVSNTKEFSQTRHGSDSYRKQILQELASHESSGQIPKQEDIPELRPTPDYCEAPQNKGRGERPIPQGGRDDVIDLSNNHMNSSRRRDGRRDASRTRHVSGGDAKRPVSSSSRYNSYSSDEQDVVEERNTRRKSKKNPRRCNATESKGSSSSTPGSLTPSKTQLNHDARSTSMPPESILREAVNPKNSSHDYVNINSLPEAVVSKPARTMNHFTKSSYMDDPLIIGTEGSLRAEPVFIDSQESWEPSEDKDSHPNSYVYSDKFYAARDPYYVSDVQMPTKLERNVDVVNGNDLTLNDVHPHEYENFNLKNGINGEIVPYDVHEDERVEKSQASYFNSKLDCFNNLQKGFRDDTSIGKYSDSGYDTLRAELPLKREEKKSTKSSDSPFSEQSDICPRKGVNPSSKRPETWSPDKFEQSPAFPDLKSKVDESKIVKEYSYEFITPDKTQQPEFYSLNEKKVMKNLSSPDLPSLESPRIVQETQQATHRNLVKDRIKCFSSISEQKPPCEKMFVVKPSQDDLEVAPCSDSKEAFRDPLTPTMPQNQSSEAYVSHLKQEFATPESKKVVAHEAQVKHLSSDSSSEKPSYIATSYSNPEYYESRNESREICSPQDMMDSRLSRSNIRKFLFDEDSLANVATGGKEGRTKKEQVPVSQSRSVKDILKNFEERSEASSQDKNCKRSIHKVYSDSELISNDSSNEDDIEGKSIQISEIFPPPPSSFLEDLEKESRSSDLDASAPLIPPPRPPKKPHLGGDMDSNGRPKSIRLSLAESIEESLLLRSESETEENGWYGTQANDSHVLNGNSPSKHSFFPLESENTLIVDLSKPPTEQAPPPPPPKVQPNFHAGPDQVFPISQEENYLPMSPPKKPGHNGNGLLSSSNSSLSSKPMATPEPPSLDGFSKLEFEEHTYIEMSGEPASSPCFSTRYDSQLPKLDMSRISENISLPPESPRYYEIGEKDGQHYEYIYKTGPQYEAIYMEVPNPEKTTSKEDKPKIPNKPHDLKQIRQTKKCVSDSAIIATKSRVNNSDGSSDADDEASKDLDSLEPPKKPRFSLSDTFRPASYYLSGGDPSSDRDAHDSSDSDLVPPPPIPLSPPPDEDLEPGTGLKISKFEYERKSSSDSPIHIRFNSNDSKISKLSQSFDRDVLDVTEQAIHRRSDSSSSNMSYKNKRRPFSEETLDILIDDESFVLRSEDIYPTSSAYPEDNLWAKRKPSKQESDISLLPEDKHDMSMRYSVISPTLSMHSRMDSPYSPPNIAEPHQESIYENSALDKMESSFNQSLSSSGIYRNFPSHQAGANELAMSPPFSDISPTNRNYQINNANSSMLSDTNPVNGENKIATTQMNLAASPVNVSHNRSSSELSTRSLASPINVATPIHVRGSSNASFCSETSPRTAPYYYSDVIRDENVPFLDGSTPTPRSRAHQLNNQRDLEANKRQDIGRKVNQISNYTEARYKESLSREIKNSFEYFDGKTIALPDERNVYEADTLRRLKARTLTPDPEQNAKNIYPFGLTVKSGDPVEISPICHRRTRSLEGLLDENNCQWNPPVILQPSHDKKFLTRGDLSNGTQEHTSVAATTIEPTAASSRSPIQPDLMTSPVQSTPQSGVQPQHASDYEPHREGSTSRLSYHDNFAISPADVSNWEDDGQWREQLRRASIRHTRSLETLEDPRRRNSTSSSSPCQEPRSPLKFSLPNEDLILKEERGQAPPDRSLDEYHVDYREGRIKPASSAHSETLERTRKGLTSLEEYEWDSVEEKFRKPASELVQPCPKNSPHLPSNGEAFLTEGLPPSSGVDADRTATCRSPLPPTGGASLTASSIQSHQSSMENLVENAHQDPEGGGRPVCDDSKDARGQLTFGEESHGQVDPSVKREQIPSRGELTPDVVPPCEDVGKFGDGLPRRPDFLGHTTSMGSNVRDSPLNSYGFSRNFEYNARNHNQGYQHLPHPHAQNPYHHYKSDELHYANARPRQPAIDYPYPDQEPAYNGPTYQNYRSPSNTYRDYPQTITSEMEPYRDSPYLTETSHPDVEEFYGHRSDDYGLYDRNIPDNEQSRYEDSFMKGDGPYQQFSDSEITVAKPLPTPLIHPEPLSPDPEEEKVLEEDDDDDGLQQGGYFAGVSAGELLGKTHEELVLLLIQLRRHQSSLLAARRHASTERDSQARLAHFDTDRSQDHINRMTYLEEHLRDLDKQYEMGKPLINLVDNMVKLGSLYRGFDSRFSQMDNRRTFSQLYKHDSLEFSRRILEKRILAEDRKEYDMVAPDQINLEEKVLQLYKLEKKLQEESLTIQNLQREKDMLERTLEDLNARSHQTNESMVELERRTRQRDHMERELSRLRAHLAVSARRLEETAAENSRLEHEMMMLRQKIQTNMARNAQREMSGSDEARHIESEMLRVQTLLEDLQKRRLELSQQIQRLTSSNSGATDLRPSPPGTVIPTTISTRRRHSTWVETDLDRMVTRDRGCESTHDLSRGGRVESLPMYGSAPRLNRETFMRDYVRSPDFSDVDYPPPPPPPEHMHSPRESKLVRSGEKRFLSDLSPSELPALTLGHSQSHYEIDTSKMREEFEYDNLGSLNRLRGLSNVPGVRAPVMDRDSADNKPDGEEQKSTTPNLDINDADEKMKRFYGILPKEKALEPKTVRIVKRESTERKRDRVSPGKKMDASLAYVAEDEMESDPSDVDSSGGGGMPLPAFANRTASLPRNYGRSGSSGDRPSSVSRMMKHHNQSTAGMARPSNLPLRNRQQNWRARTDSKNDHPLSAHEQLFGAPRDHQYDATSPLSSPSKSDPPSPVFKSAAAQEIVKEIAWEAEKHRRAVPKQKRRHFTVSSSKPLSLETGTGNTEGARSRDDCDMVRALRPRNHPDVVKSTLSTRDLRFNESTIDTILGAPRKIAIPERYMPDEDDEKELSSAEKKYREEKARAIRKMLAESTTSITKADHSSEDEGRDASGEQSSDAKEKMEAEKKEREHLLAMNQILAKQVMEKSRIVAATTSFVESYH